MLFNKRSPKNRRREPLITEKHRRWLAASAAFLVISGGLLLAAEYRKANQAAVTIDFIMDTVVEQTLYGENASLAAAEIAEQLREFEQNFSMHLPDSPISQLNEAAGREAVMLPEDVYALLSRSKELSLQSMGAFDVTIAPLTKAWGITTENPSVPDAEALAAAMALVDANALQLNKDGTAMLERAGQAVDLGGIAKGAACDIVRSVAEKYGIEKGYVSIGGNMVVLEKKPLGRDIYIGVRDPQASAADAICAVALYGKTMATTGAYERYFEEDGVRYHHVLDPQTGYPADSELLSVSVISEDGTLADYLSTTLFVLGRETVLTCLEREDFQVIAVTHDGQVYCSSSLEGEIQPTKNSSAYEFVYGES